MDKKSIINPMKPHILTHKKRTEIRKEPLNLVAEDLHLFEKALVLEIEETTALHLKILMY